MSKVKLISHSIGVNGESLKELVIYCARVSNPESQLKGEGGDKLWNYLKTHNHWSPFETVSLCMEINTTRDIARQILRHRSFSFQEFSQRYADPTKDLDFVTREARLQDPYNRQNSIKSDNDGLHIEWHKRQREVINAATDEYNWAVRNGIAKEQARAVLPEGITASRLYMSGTLRSWFHWIEVRENEDTQLEHRELAIEAKKIIEELI